MTEIKNCPKCRAQEGELHKDWCERVVTIIENMCIKKNCPDTQVDEGMCETHLAYE